MKQRRRAFGGATFGRVRCLFLPLLALFAATACAADAVDVPEPTLDTKGAFIAVGLEGDDGYELLRSLAVLGDGSDNDVFFVASYGVKPVSFDEAREFAQDFSLEPREVITVGRVYITSREWRVVWFRSVSVEEEAAFR